MPNTTKRKKRPGAALSGAVMGGLMLLLCVCTLWDYFGSNGRATAEGIVIILCALVCLAVAVGIAIALRQRWREIERGEEDEARKY